MNVLGKYNIITKNDEEIVGYIYGSNTPLDCIRYFEEWSNGKFFDASDEEIIGKFLIDTKDEDEIDKKDILVEYTIDLKKMKIYGITKIPDVKTGEWCYFPINVKEVAINYIKCILEILTTKNVEKLFLLMYYLSWYERFSKLPDEWFNSELYIDVNKLLNDCEGCDAIKNNKEKKSKKKYRKKTNKDLKLDDFFRFNEFFKK